MSNEPWGEEQILELRKLLALKFGPAEIAKRLGLSKKQITKMVAILREGKNVR